MLRPLERAGEHTAGERRWPNMLKPANADVAPVVRPEALGVEGVDGEHVAVRAVPGRRSGADVAGHAGVVADLRRAGREARAVRRAGAGWPAR